tara:strand:+ start:577 stop:3867 length:3291 start_codon:yes stop_codon:yes gene_type:complete
MFINDNIKISKVFGRDFYYNVGNSEKLKEKGIYSSPLEVAIFKRENTTDFIIKNNIEGRANREYTRYGAMSFDEIKGIWMKNNNIFEIIENKSRKPYFDIDKIYKNELDWKKTISKLHKLLLTININIYDRDKTAFCVGKGDKEGQIKISAHIVINDGFIYKDKTEQKRVMEYLKGVIYENNDYILLREGVLDFNVYSSNQAFKLPYQSKVYKNIIQKPKDKYLCELGHFLVSNVSKLDKWIDTKKYIVESAKITITKANGIKKQVDFNVGDILNEYKLAFDKDYKIEVKNNGEDELELFLKCIPNNEKVSFRIWKIIGYCISKITKNSKEGLTLWTKWTQPFKKVVENDLKPFYYKNSITSGYGWNMLENLATIFNTTPLRRIGDLHYLFKDKPKYNHKLIEFNTPRNSDGYSLKNQLKNNDILTIKAGMGRGKSYDFRKIFDLENIEGDLVYDKILYFSCNRAFCKSMTKDFNQYGFKSYMEEEIEDEERVIISIESLYKIRRMDWDLVVIDESETIFSNLTGEMNLKNRCLGNLNRFIEIMKCGAKIVCMDAYIGQRTYNAIEDIYKKDFKNKNITHIVNKCPPKKREYVDCGSNQGLADSIVAKLKNNQKVVLVSGSQVLQQQILEKIKIEIPDFYKDKTKWKFYDKNNPLNLDVDLNNEWVGLYLLMYSPTITAGISYTNPNWEFDYLFIYGVNVNSCLMRDTIQASRRVRNFTSNLIYVAINTQYSGFDYNKYPIKLKDVEHLQEWKNLLFEGEDILSLKDNEELQFMYRVYLYNKLEFCINSYLYRDVFEIFFQRENITELKDDDDDYKDESGEGLERFTIDFFSYDKIKTINEETYKKYVEKIQSSKNEKHRKRIYKYNYNNSIKPLDEIEKAGYFNFVYSIKELKDYSMKVCNFKRFLYEIKYDIKNWDIHRDVISNNVLNKELYDIQFKLRKHIFYIMGKIGLIENGNINMNKELLNSDFKQDLINEYEKMDVRTINGLLENNPSINRKKGIDFTITQMKTIFNTLLKEAFKIQLYTKGKKSIYTNGKKKNETIIGFKWFFTKSERANMMLRIKKEDILMGINFMIMDKGGLNPFNIYKNKWVKKL